MAERDSPELYLSLLSGRQGNIPHLSAEQRDHDDGSHLRDPQLHKDPDRLLDVLDALAAICVRKEKDIFFVSLAMNQNTTTLYVSTNGTVPAILTNHLRMVRSHLKDLKSVLEPASSPPPDIESLDPNITLSRNEGELKVQRSIYEYSYKKLQCRYQKKGPVILAQYDALTKRLQSTFVAEDAEYLALTHGVLERIDDLLKDEIPQESRLTILIETITAMSCAWKQRLETVEDNDLLTRWDNLTGKFDPTSPIDDTIAHLLFLAVKQNRNLSLRRFLQKMFTLHNHIRTILRITWSRRFSSFLEGEFNVVLVPAAHGDTLVKFSQQKVLHIAFPPEDKTPQNIKQMVYNELLSRVQAKADIQKIEMKKEEELSLTHINVHAECSLLAYHIQHPEIIPYRYFGGSKLSCHGCSVFFSSFNGLATSSDNGQFFTKGCNDKIYLRWPCPSLLSQYGPHLAQKIFCPPDKT